MTRSTNTRRDGLKGWHLVYWLLLCWLWPFFSVIRFLTVVKESRGLETGITVEGVYRSEVLLWTLAEAAIFLGFAAWGIWVGMCITRRKNSAGRMNEIFLVTKFGATIFVGAIAAAWTLTADLNDSAVKSLLEHIAIATARDGVHVAAWWYYFSIKRANLEAASPLAEERSKYLVEYGQPEPQLQPRVIAPSSALWPVYEKLRHSTPEQAAMNEMAAKEVATQAPASRRGDNKASMDTSFYSQVAAELSAGNYDEGLWLQMLAKNKGDEKKAHAAYITARVSQLAREAKESGIDTRPPLEGIKGWLRLYCLLAGGVWPTIALLNLINSHVVFSHTITLEKTAQSQWTGLIKFEAMLYFALSCWGVYAVRRLLALDNSAPRMNKWFLQTKFCIVLLIPAVELALGQKAFHLGLVEDILITFGPPLGIKGMIVLRTLADAIIIVAWWQYFRVSRRVKGTYWENP